jgi:hypothetical protein
MIDIEWSQTGTRSILAKRIKSYLALAASTDDAIEPALVVDDSETEPMRRRLFKLSDESALKKIFPSSYPWGRGTREAFQVIHVISAGRPRWALQLTRMTAGVAVRYGDDVLKYGYMKQILPKYAKFRIDDLIKEHSHQCSDVENLIFAFGNSDFTFSTAKLLAFIGDRICRHVDVYIDRNDEKATALEIAHFLYRIGFIEAVDLQNFSKHYHYDTTPHLLRSITAIHDHVRWEIRASYRAALTTSEKIEN